MIHLTDTRDLAHTMAARTTDPRDTSRDTGPFCDLAHFYQPHHDECRCDVCRCDCHERYVPDDAERALWTRIADEIDAHLAPVDEGPGLGVVA